MADVSINTVTKLLVDAGEAAFDLHDKLVRNVEASKVQCDEIWSFTSASSATSTRPRPYQWMRATCDVDGHRRRYKADPHPCRC